jgi:hypothetical protein
MVETKGMTAVIKVGDITKDITVIQDANHAWVLAEISPGKWIALEPTGGYLVCNNQKICLMNNPRYYAGWSFKNPKDFKDEVDKLKHPCEDGYVLGTDDLCHVACGGARYCTGNSVCVNGECRGCPTGYYLGTDLHCHRS